MKKKSWDLENWRPVRQRIRGPNDMLKGNKDSEYDKFVAYWKRIQHHPVSFIFGDYYEFCWRFRKTKFTERQ